jgi:hypothetical protein
MNELKNEKHKKMTYNDSNATDEEEELLWVPLNPDPMYS